MSKNITWFKREKRTTSFISTSISPKKPLLDTKPVGIAASYLPTSLLSMDILRWLIKLKKNKIFLKKMCFSFDQSYIHHNSVPEHF